MRNIFVALVVIVAAVAVAGCGGTNLPADAQEVKSELSRNMTPAADGVADLTQGIRTFGFDIYHELVAANDGKNIFLSPHSVAIALAMAYAGAKGDTAAQMKVMMGFTGDDAATHEAFNAMDLDLDKRGTEQLKVDEDGDPFELSVVNQAWGRIGFNFLEAYLDVLALNYGAGLYLLDFTDDPDGSRLTINDWVADQTHDRILDLLPAGSISPATALVLTNVIYFKASWLDKFDVANTVDAQFNRLDGTKVDVKMMHKYDELLHGTGDGYEFLRVPYVGENVEMILVLPNPGQFTEVEAAMDGAAFDAMLAASESAQGNLALPRFTFGFESSLNDSLMALGMTDAFTSGVADFSGIDDRPGNLFISLVQHKSFVAVDEKGTEAAAATAVVIDEGTAVLDSFDMTFDRPFLFAIYDRPTGAILFLGRVMDPTAP